ncbi:MAG TPA: hypothetical protein VGX94_19360 [Terriglobia bacterium]|nr:hypothetical protein [Terriglobia bacterium]
MTEEEMSNLIFTRFGAKWMGDDFERKYAAREVPIKVKEGEYDINKDCKLDIVEYDKQKKIFKIVELKSGCSNAIVRDAFKQLKRYREMLEGRTFIFLDAFTRKSPMRFGRVMEATLGGKEIRIEFYVGLTDEACENVDRLRSLKKEFPHIGIIRVKDDGKLRDYIKERDGTRNYELAKAQTVHFVLTWPPAANDLDNGAPISGAVAENELCSISR